MKIKLLIGILLTIALSTGGYYYYQYQYVRTLMLSEVVGHTDNDIVNILVNLGDFDTGLTRNDVSNLKSNGDYWIRRMNEVNAISDQQTKQNATINLNSES